MSQQELLIQVVDVLQALDIQYLITGSWASTLQGEPRSTHDIDLVVSLAADKVDSLLAEFMSDRFYLDRTAMQQAIAHQTMFNLLDTNEGDKVDFWILTEEPWDQSRWRRRVSFQIWGRQFLVSSPEDTILAKLRWSKLSGGSEKQFNDALRVFEVNVGTLDERYISHWAASLDVEPLWNRIQSEAGV